MNKRGLTNNQGGFMLLLGVILFMLILLNGVGSAVQFVTLDQIMGNNENAVPFAGLEDNFLTDDVNFTYDADTDNLIVDGNLTYQGIEIDTRHYNQTTTTYSQDRREPVNNDTDFNRVITPLNTDRPNLVLASGFVIHQGALTSFGRIRCRVNNVVVLEPQSGQGGAGLGVQHHPWSCIFIVLPGQDYEISTEDVNGNPDYRIRMLRELPM